MNGLSMLMGMGGGAGYGQGNNDLMTMMLFQQMSNGGDSGDISDNKRLQMLLFAPLGKKFLTRIARKIQQVAEAEGRPIALSVAELHAADLLRDLEEEQEGDLKQIFKMARLSVRMRMLGASGIESGGGMGYQAERGEEEQSPQALSGGTIGGYVKGRLADRQTPMEELEEVMGKGEGTGNKAVKVSKAAIKKKSWE